MAAPHRHRGSLLLLLAGALVLLAAWAGPLPSLAKRAFAAHMTLHVTLVAIAAPLLALGLRPWLKHSRGAAILGAPVLAAALEFFVMWGWHLPGPHFMARSTLTGFVLEQTSFLGAGLLMWTAALSGGRSGAAAGAGGLLLTSMHLTLLGALLTLSPRPLYAQCGGAFGLSPAEDQALGGTIMLAVGTPVYLIGGLALVASVLRGRDEPLPPAPERSLR